MKFLNFIYGVVAITFGVKILIDGKVSIKGNVISTEYLVYPIGVVLLGFGLYIFYLICKSKKIEL
jgi:hypothetical protein